MAGPEMPKRWHRAGQGRETHGGLSTGVAQGAGAVSPEESTGLYWRAGDGAGAAGGRSSWRGDRGWGRVRTASPPRLGSPHLTLAVRRTRRFRRQRPGHRERQPRSTHTWPYLRAPTRPQLNCACASPASRAGPESRGRTRAHLARTAAVSLLRGTRPPPRRWLQPGSGAGAAGRGRAEAVACACALATACTACREA